MPLACLLVCVRVSGVRQVYNGQRGISKGVRSAIGKGVRSAVDLLATTAQAVAESDSRGPLVVVREGCCERLMSG